MYHAEEAEIRFRGIVDEPCTRQPSDHEVQFVAGFETSSAALESEVEVGVVDPGLELVTGG